MKYGYVVPNTLRSYYYRSSIIYRVPSVTEVACESEFETIFQIILLQESCYIYWPTKQGLTIKYRDIEVTLESEEKNHGYVVRKFEVFYGQSQSTTVRKQLHHITML